MGASGGQRGPRPVPSANRSCPSRKPPIRGCAAMDAAVEHAPRPLDHRPERQVAGHRAGGVHVRKAPSPSARAFRSTAMHRPPPADPPRPSRCRGRDPQERPCRAVGAAGSGFGGKARAAGFSSGATAVFEVEYDRSRADPWPFRAPAPRAWNVEKPTERSREVTHDSAQSPCSGAKRTMRQREGRGASSPGTPFFQPVSGRRGGVFAERNQFFFLSFTILGPCVARIRCPTGHNRPTVLNLARPPEQFGGSAPVRSPEKDGQ